MADETVNRIVRRAKKALMLNRRELSQVVAPKGYSDFYRLGDYFEKARPRDVIGSPYSDGFCPRIDTLDEGELARVVTERLRDSGAFLVYKDRRYTADQLIEHIEGRTDVGKEIIEQHRLLIEYLEGMIDAGKAKMSMDLDS